MHQNNGPVHACTKAMDLCMHQNNGPVSNGPVHAPKQWTCKQWTCKQWACVCTKAMDLCMHQSNGPLKQWVCEQRQLDIKTVDWIFLYHVQVVILEGDAVSDRDEEEDPDNHIRRIQSALTANLK